MKQDTVIQKLDEYAKLVSQDMSMAQRHEIILGQNIDFQNSYSLLNISVRVPGI